ncbi:MAG: lipoate--protein ligase [Acholeplasmatales bacterium]
MKFVKLDTKQRIDPFYFALEEYLLEKDEEYIFIWDVFNSVIIGKNQLLHQEVHLDYLKKNNIKVYRRPSGGGAVYNDYGCIKYSFISKRPKSEMYDVFLGLIKDFLKEYISVYFSGRNDLLFNEMKFSGNAYYQTKKGHILHGTILYDTDLTVLKNALNPSKLKLESKGIKSVKSRVTNLKPYINLSREEFRKALDNYFMRFETVTLSNKEILEVKKKMAYYNNDEYIYGRNPQYKIEIKERFPYGEVIIYMDILNEKIADIEIYGDFFEREPLNVLKNKIIGVSKKDLEKIMNLNPSVYIEGMSNIDLYNLIRRGF